MTVDNHLPPVIHLCFLTVARSDLQRLLPVLSQLTQSPHIKLSVIPASLHQSTEKLYTYNELNKLNVTIIEGCDSHLSSDSAGAWVKEFSLITSFLSVLFCNHSFDALVLFGDRYEMLAGAISALPFNIYVIHLMGGAVTLGAVDESVRHSITKLSHLHLTACSEYSNRVIQMGEDPRNVHTVGSPGIDFVLQASTHSIDELSNYFGLELNSGFLFCCFHPVTQEVRFTESYITQLLDALSIINLPVIFSYPNSDFSCDIIVKYIELFCFEHPKSTCFIKSAEHMFASTLRLASCIVGNSSAGIVESSAFCTPSVNIGSRQTGKSIPANVINSDYTTTSIVSRIRLALSLDFRRSLSAFRSVYGDGNASIKIANRLALLSYKNLNTSKKFYDLTLTE